MSELRAALEDALRKWFPAREPKIHELKCWPVFFAHVWTGEKPFEVRKNDRGYDVRDGIWLREWDPKTNDYTGRELATKITYVFPSSLMEMLPDVLRPEFVILGLDLGQRNLSRDALLKNTSLDPLHKLRLEVVLQGGEAAYTRSLDHRFMRVERVDEAIWAPLSNLKRDRGMK